MKKGKLDKVENNKRAVQAKATMRLQHFGPVE
jgi:hypothetical protein